MTSMRNPDATPGSTVTTAAARDDASWRFFSFHGVGIAMHSDDPVALSAATHDFSWFLAEGGATDFTIRFRRGAPDYAALPRMKANVVTPRNVVYSDGSKAYIDYSGKALNIYDKNARSCDITSNDPVLAHEIIYLTMLSRVSELLERRGLHRIHALGLDYHGAGVLVLLPSGGGKTTLTMQLLADREHDLRLLSEDSPLLDARGMILPFPLRLGADRDVVPAGIDPAYLRRIRRMEYDPKTTIDVRWCGDRLAPRPVRPSFVFLGVRSTWPEPSITRVRARSAVKHVLVNSVIGIGLFQGMEFIAQKSFRESLAALGLLFSRARCNYNLLRLAQVCEFTLAPDPARNWQALRQFLDHHGGAIGAHGE